MPRTARVTHRGGFYHLYNRSLNKHPVFKNFQDLDYFLKKFAKIVGDGDWTIYAYCIMPTHYYILIEEKKMPVAKFISRLFTSYGVYYNKKYKRSGPLFSDRFKSKIIQKDSYFLQVSRYIHLNPVAANLVRNPEYYLYSSLAEYLKKVERGIIDLDKITRLLQKNKTSIASYLEFVKAGRDKNLEEFNPFAGKKEVLGSKAFTGRKQSR